MIPKVLASPEAVVDMEMGSLAAAAAAAAAAAIPLAIPPAELPEPAPTAAATAEALLRDRELESGARFGLKSFSLHGMYVIFFMGLRRETEYCN